MQISIKNASILADDILGKVTRTSLKTATSISAYVEIDAAAITADLEVRRTELRRKLETNLALVKVAYALRGRIGRANVEKGVAEKLTRRAELSKEAEVIRTGLGIAGGDEDIYTRTLGAPEPDADPKTVASRLVALKTRLEAPTAPANLGDTVQIGFAGPLREEYDDRLSVIDREKRVLAAEIAAINGSAQIEITEEEEAVLKASRLL
jgi:hypothetical protein